MSKKILVLIIYSFIVQNIYSQSDTISILISLDEWNLIKYDTIPALIPLQPATNYVLKIQVKKRIKIGKCDCLDVSSHCYLYLMKVDSVLYIENEEIFNKNNILCLNYFCSSNLFLIENQTLIGTFRNTETKNYISLTTIIPSDGKRKLCFYKDFPSIVGEIDCLGSKKYPFFYFFKRKSSAR